MILSSGLCSSSSPPWRRLRCGRLLKFLLLHPRNQAFLRNGVLKQLLSQDSALHSGISGIGCVATGRRRFCARTRVFRGSVGFGGFKIVAYVGTDDGSVQECCFARISFRLAVDGRTFFLRVGSFWIVVLFWKKWQHVITRSSFKSTRADIFLCFRQMIPYVSALSGVAWMTSNRFAYQKSYVSLLIWFPAEVWTRSWATTFATKSMYAFSTSQKTTGTHKRAGACSRSGWDIIPPTLSRWTPMSRLTVGLLLFVWCGTWFVTKETLRGQDWRNLPSSAVFCLARWRKSRKWLICAILFSFFCFFFFFFWVLEQNLLNFFFFGPRYKKFCFFDPLRHEEHGIQLYCPSNCVIFDDASFFVGADSPSLKRLCARVKSVINQKNCQHLVVLNLCGSTRSGKSLLARKYFPRVFDLPIQETNSDFPAIFVFDDFEGEQSEEALQRIPLGSVVCICYKNPTPRDEQPPSKRAKTTRIDLDFNCDSILPLQNARELADFQLLMRHCLCADKFLLKQILYQAGVETAFAPLNPAVATVSVDVRAGFLVSVFMELKKHVFEDSVLSSLCSQRDCVVAWNRKSFQWEEARAKLHKMISQMLSPSQESKLSVFSCFSWIFGGFLSPVDFCEDSLEYNKTLV